MAKHKELVFCAGEGCGDRLRLTVVLTARIGLLRADWSEDHQYRHTTRRWDNRYNPDLRIVAVRKVKLRWNARNMRRDYHLV
jgi:hypothetical protein